MICADCGRDVESYVTCDACDRSICDGCDTRALAPYTPLCAEHRPDEVTLCGFVTRNGRLSPPVEPCPNHSATVRCACGYCEMFIS